MKKYKLEQIVVLPFNSRKALIFSVFFFLVGISSGVFLEVAMNSEDKLQVAQFLQQYLYINGDLGQAITYPNPFLSSASANLVLLFAICISGLSMIGFPAAYGILVYKGLALGFSSGLLLETLKFKGAGLLLVSMMPQNLLLIPAFILAASAAQNYAIDILRQRKNNSGRAIKKNSAVTRNPYIMTNMLLAIMILLGCIIEALLFPILT